MVKKSLFISTLTFPYKVLDVLSLLSFAIAAYITARYYPELPERIPVHIGFNGEVDGWGNKKMFFLMPGIMLFTYVSMSIASAFPSSFNYPVKITSENKDLQQKIALQMVSMLKCATIWLFVFLQWDMAEIAVNHKTVATMQAIFFILFLVFAIVGTGVYRSFKAK